MTINNTPLGYVTPKFPSLYWPINNDKFNVSYLYYTKDIWKFTLYWSLILFCAVYGASGLIAGYSHRTPTGRLWIIALYLLIGGIQGFLSGTAGGFM